MAHLLVAMDWPRVDAGAAAGVLAPLLGDHSTDVAAGVHRSRGLVEVALDAAAAERAAAALRAAGMRFCAVGAEWMPRLPKPRTTRRLDPRGHEALTLQIALTGPPLALPWSRVLAALPALWTEGHAASGGLPAKGRSLAGAAMSIATTGGVGMLLARPEIGGGSSAVTTTARPMLAVVAHGGPDVGHQRFQIFADAADYRVLAAPTQKVADNWAALLGAVAARLRPDLAGADELARAAAGEPPSGDLVVDDDNLLERTLRHRMMCAALARMGW